MRSCGRSKENTASHHYHARKMQERNVSNLTVNSLKKKVLERLILERSSLQKARQCVNDSSDAESGIAGIETFCTQMPEQVTLTLAGQDADILWNYCSIEDITGKPSTQLKAPALILNTNGEVIVRKMFDNTTQAK